MTEQLGVIKEVGVGLYDRNEPILWFTVYVGDASASLQWFEWEKAGKIIKDYNVRDVKSMNGRTCWVEVDKGIMTYLRASKI